VSRTYRQPERATFEGWRRALPDGLIYAVKLNSFDTMAGLGPKAAVVLVQLPARFRFDAERLARFFR
jgi:uncharacterized protein YecE (DUF72 family)